MKMKYLVLGASCLALGASTAWAVPTIKDRSIVGHWKFDDPSDYGKDTSGYGGTSFSFTSGQIDGSASGSGAKWSDVTDTGYVTIAKKSTGAYSASAQLGSGNTISSSGYQTMAAWFRSGCSIGRTTGDKGVDQVISHIDDHAWHFGAMRRHYKAAPYSSTRWLITTDPSTWGTKEDDGTYLSEASSGGDWSEGKPSFPVTVSSTSVTLGGKIGTSVTANFYGDIDEAMVINRMLCKNELTRLYQTGEAYIYSSGTPTFDNYTGWSFTLAGVDDKCATLKTWVPGVIKQTTYLIDCQKTMTYGSGAAAYFGQSADNKVALAVGRAEVLKNRLTGADLINGNNLKGTISITAENTALSFWDLRLNAGSITANANNQSVTADMLDVEGEPFNVSVPANCEFAFNAGGKVTGDGILAKTGPGKLILNNFVKGADRAGFVDAPKFRMTEGSVKTAVLNGYTGGTVLIGGTPTTIASGDTISKAVAFKFETAPTAVGSYQAFALDGVSLAENNFSDTTTGYPSDLLHSVRVADNKVYVDLETPPDPIIEWNMSGGTDVGANIDKMTLPISLKYTGAAAPAAGTYSVQTIGGAKTYTAANFGIDWNGVSLPSYMSAAVTVNGKVLSVVVTDNRAKLPDADKGEVPVLIGQ